MMMMMMMKLQFSPGDVFWPHPVDIRLEAALLSM